MCRAADSCLADGSNSWPLFDNAKRQTNPSLGCALRVRSAALAEGTSEAIQNRVAASLSSSDMQSCSKEIYDSHCWCLRTWRTRSNSRQGNGSDLTSVSLDSAAAMVIDGVTVAAAEDISIARNNAEISWHKRSHFVSSTFRRISFPDGAPGYAMMQDSRDVAAALQACLNHTILHICGHFPQEWVSAEPSIRASFSWSRRCFAIYSNSGTLSR